MYICIYYVIIYTYDILACIIYLLIYYMYVYVIKVADLMDELGVHEKTADASFTPDPYDPSGYSVRCSLNRARSAVIE
jgi:hypothetical protein